MLVENAAPSADYVMTGVSSPDVSGGYSLIAPFGGYAQYKHTTKEYYVVCFDDEGDKYYEIHGAINAGWPTLFSKGTDNPFGTYSPYEPQTGNPIFSEA